MEKIKKIWYLFGPLVLGLIISLLIKDNIDYEYLVQPKFAPPSWLFGIAWTILYLLMGISFYLYKRNGEWKFEAIGNGFKGGLQQLVNKYCY